MGLGNNAKNIYSFNSQRTRIRESQPSSMTSGGLKRKKGGGRRGPTKYGREKKTAYDMQYWQIKEGHTFVKN